MSFVPKDYRLRKGDKSYLNSQYYLKNRKATLKTAKQLASERIKREIEAFLADSKNKIKVLSSDEFGYTPPSATKRQKKIKL